MTKCALSPFINIASSAIMVFTSGQTTEYLSIILTKTFNSILCNRQYSIPSCPISFELIDFSGTERILFAVKEFHTNNGISYVNCIDFACQES